MLCVLHRARACPFRAPIGRSGCVGCGDLGATMTHRPWAETPAETGGVAVFDSRGGKGVMKFKSPIQVGGVSFADDLQRCLGWSTALAAPQPATSVTFLLAILEAGRGTTAQRVLDDAGVTTHDLEPLEVAARARQPAAKGLKRLARRVPGLTYGADLERVLRRAIHLVLLDKRRVPDQRRHVPGPSHEDGPARAALVSLGKDPSAMRSEVMRSRPVPE